MIENLAKCVDLPGHSVSIRLGEALWVTLAFSPIATVLAALVLSALAIYRFWPGLRGGSFEIDEAEFGIGNQKIKLKPNYVDRQIAYQVWVELSTRKIGLPIDPENDVIVEVYDSWYSLFSVTRELIKEVPVSKLKRKDTQKIVRLLIDVLNNGVRPHLTSWQARFRRWYAAQLEKENFADQNPQDIQKQYPEYEALISDMLAVNSRLISYRERMYKLVTGLDADPLSN